MVNYIRQRLLMEFDNIEEYEQYYQKYKRLGYVPVETYCSISENIFGFEVELKG